jgi:hypothetical protein
MEGWMCNAAFAFFSITAAIPDLFLLSSLGIAILIRYQNCVLFYLSEGEAVRIGTGEWGKW